MEGNEYMEWMGVNLAIPNGFDFVIPRELAKRCGADPDNLPPGWTLAKPMPEDNGDS